MHSKQHSGALSGVQWVNGRLDRCITAMYSCGPSRMSAKRLLTYVVTNQKS